MRAGLERYDLKAGQNMMSINAIKRRRGWTDERQRARGGRIVTKNEIQIAASMLRLITPQSIDAPHSISRYSQRPNPQPPMPLPRLYPLLRPLRHLPQQYHRRIVYGYTRCRRFCGRWGTSALPVAAATAAPAVVVEDDNDDLDLDEEGSPVYSANFFIL